MKLTPLGKLALGIVALLFVGLSWLVIKPDDSGPDYTVAAELSFSPDRLARSVAAEDAYRNRATKATSYCNFFSGYRQNRGKPLWFDAYIPSNYSESVYYYEDPESGEQYIPAYFIAPGGSGLSLARGFAQEDYERLPSCAPSPETGGAGGVILLGFPRGRLPQGQYVRSYGELWWDSINLNPAQVSTEAGAESAPAPVVKVATFDRLTTSQASDPANETFPMNVAVQRGPGVIRVSRLEFADNETRVWVELVNLTAKSLDAWAGSTGACVRPAGEDCITAGSVTASGDEDLGDTGENQVANDDTLAPDAPIPPAASGASLAGYLTFSRLDPGQELQLELPDFSDSADDSPTAPITVQLPNKRTATAVDTAESGDRLAGSDD